MHFKLSNIRGSHGLNLAQHRRLLIPPLADHLLSREQEVFDAVNAGHFSANLSQEKSASMFLCVRRANSFFASIRSASPVKSFG